MRKTTLFIIITLLGLSSFALAETNRSRNFTLKEPGIVISAGNADSDSYSVKGAIAGEPFGGSAESAAFTLNTYIASAKANIAACPLDWAPVTLGPGESVVTGAADRIIVNNTGDVKLLFRLRALDASGTWVPSETANGNDINKFAISGVFTDTAVTDIGDVDFNESGDDDIILDEFREAGDTRFAAISSPANGRGVMPGEERALWIKFRAPIIDTTHDSQHNLWLILEAKEVK